MDWDSIMAEWPRIHIDERGYWNAVPQPPRGIFESPLNSLAAMGYMTRTEVKENEKTTVSYNVSEKGEKYISAFKRAIKMLYEEREPEIDFTPRMPFPLKNPGFISAGSTNYFSVPLMWAAGDDMADLPYTREEAKAAEKIAFEIMGHSSGPEELLEYLMNLATEWKESGEYLYGEDADKFMADMKEEEDELNRMSGRDRPPPPW